MTSDYPQSMHEAAAKAYERPSSFMDLLMDYWADDYLEKHIRAADIVIYEHGTFNYLFDLHQQKHDHLPEHNCLPVCARLIAAIGNSKPTGRKRDDSRLRGLPVGGTDDGQTLWDKGHFIANSIGGVVDGNEMNIFLQRRSVNRGGYRKMENYCIRNPGTICFSRPLYSDSTAHPQYVEFGIVRPDGILQVELFVNR